MKPQKDRGVIQLNVMNPTKRMKVDNLSQTHPYKIMLTLPQRCTSAPLLADTKPSSPVSRPPTRHSPVPFCRCFYCESEGIPSWPDSTQNKMAHLAAKHANRACPLLSNSYQMDAK